MRRTGDRSVVALALGLVLAAAGVPRPALAQEKPEIRQSADRKEVGTEDTFRVTVSVSNPPDGSQLNLSPTDDFEILSRSQSTEMSYQMLGGGPGVIKRTQKWVLVMRANRPGTLVVPPAELHTPDGVLKAEPITITVRRGHVEDPNAGRGSPSGLMQPFNPFQGFPFPEDFEDPFAEAPDITIPRSDSDLFLRATVDRDAVYVGEQVTLSLYVFSRVDLSSVDTLTMPKLEGFWAEDVDSPSQLSGEQRVIGGVPYRAYLLKRRALFPVKAGTLKIGPAEADVTTGFLFAGRRVHRKGNELTIQARPLPTAGRPPGFPGGNVGVWRLTAELSQPQVELGQPVTVKVTVEGRGNLKSITVPPLTVPAGLRAFDPTIADRQLSSRGHLGGRRVLEYLVMPQQTGTFTIPAIEMPYFDPERGRYEVARSEPTALSVIGAPSAPTASAPATDGKNVLAEAERLRPLRYRARFSTASAPLWEQGYFLPALVAPVALWLGLLGFGLLRDLVKKDDPETQKRRRARAARVRLAAAEKLLEDGDASAFYGEVEKAALHFLEARLGVPVGGLTRDDLSRRMSEASVPDDRRQAVLALLDQCDLGRFAPGAGGAASREEVLENAARMMEGWTA
jgi:hypothetical protein